MVCRSGAGRENSPREVRVRGGVAKKDGVDERQPSLRDSLKVTWLQWRGPGTAKFEPDQARVLDADGKQTSTGGKATTQGHVRHPRDIRPQGLRRRHERLLDSARRNRDRDRRRRTRRRRQVRWHIAHWSQVCSRARLPWRRCSRSLAVIERGKPTTLRGEVVEISCYQKKGIAGGTGDAHAACAKECAQKGLALGLSDRWRRHLQDCRQPDRRQQRQARALHREAGGAVWHAGGAVQQLRRATVVRRAEDCAGEEGELARSFSRCSSPRFSEVINPPTGARMSPSTGTSRRSFSIAVRAAIGLVEARRSVC